MTKSLSSMYVRRLRPLLIHYHIFKNAGTSVGWALKNALGDRFDEYDSVDPNGVLSPDQVAEYVTGRPETEAVSSHHAILPPPKIEGRHVYSSILLRDPIARIRSIYAFERQQQVSTQGALKAKELDFRQYVEWRLSADPAMLCNSQVYFCCRAKGGSVDAVPVAITLERAIANLDQVDVVGTVERYEEWLSLAQSTLGEAFPGIALTASRHNVTSSSPADRHTVLDGLAADLGASIVDRLLENNELDMRLHQVADAILARKLAETGSGISLRTAYQDAQQSSGEACVPNSPGTGADLVNCAT